MLKKSICHVMRCKRRNGMVNITNVTECFKNLMKKLLLIETNKDRRHKIGDII